MSELTQVMELLFSGITEHKTSMYAHSFHSVWHFIASFFHTHSRDLPALPQNETNNHVSPRQMPKSIVVLSKFYRAWE